MVIDEGEIKRGIVAFVASSVAGDGDFLDVHLVDEHRVAEFSSTNVAPELQQFRVITLRRADENRKWVRGWMDAEEMRALIVAEALA